MNWVKNLLKNWLLEEDDDEWHEKATAPSTNGSLIMAKDPEGVIDHRKSYTLRMQPANGGTILEVSHYDKKDCEYNRDLYIVNDHDELGPAISKILVQYRLTHC